MKQGVVAPSIGILLSLSILHGLNDALQSAVTASYPLLKDDLTLSFSQIGLITLTYQIAASVFQPVIGLFYDRHPYVWSLPIGTCFTLVGFISLAFATTLLWAMCSVFMVGVGSSTLHPEASRLTSIASGGKRGMAQSLFQVGGNFGGAVGPLLVAFLAAPYGRRYISFFSILSVIAIIVAIPVCRWYKNKLQLLKQENRAMKVRTESPLPMKTAIFPITILLLLIFSKYVYMASLSSYYTFYLIEKFHVDVQDSQIYLFVFLGATAIGTLLGGPVGDKIGRKYVIWASILGAAPFTLLMPHVNLFWTVVMSFFIGLIISSAFPAILLYAQELLPYKLGLVSGLFFGFAFGIAGIASAILGKMADLHGIETVYRICAYMPLLGIITYFLPTVPSQAP
ncbi:MAG: MFS transporter [Dysgonamonadaceae bacterium]|jgi:FSR family fosmidomycin resistance protein-like MFS transporter|nr:MFS transporter [Dysgonamonadaceae bacterium]